MGEGASQGSSWFLEKLVHGKKEERQAGRKKWKWVWREGVLWHLVLSGGDTHLCLLFDSIHSLLGLFAKLTWGYVLSFPNQSPDFPLESFLFFTVFYPPWDEAFVDSHCMEMSKKKKKKNGGVSNWKTCLNLFQTLSDSKPFWLPDQGILQGLKPWCR